MTTDDLLNFLNDYFRVQHYTPEERGGYLRHTSSVINSLLLALEPTPQLYKQVEIQSVDALWLHRPWKLDLSRLPVTMPVLYHHLPFDETLTLGYNTLLASELSLTNLETIGYKQAENLPPRPIGMLGSTQPTSLESWQTHLENVFGGLDSVVGTANDTIDRVAVVGAMTEKLILEAVERGANLYITGQFRQPARKAVEQTGLSVVAVGHLRSEEWGLSALKQVLQGNACNAKTAQDF